MCKVYVLFHETNTGRADDSDGYVEAIYATPEVADAAYLAAIRAAVKDGRDVYWNPDTEEEGPSDWTDDWCIQIFDVLTDVESAATAKIDHTDLDT